MIDSTVEASVESKKDVSDESEFVKTWLDAITLADKEEENWRKDAENATKIYRRTDDKRGADDKREFRFNILHSNIETLLPALYNSTPIPDVRRRYADKDALGKQVCDILERCLSYAVDSYDFDHTMELSVKDMELCGRGVDRVRYVPYLEQGGQDDPGENPEGKVPELAYEEVCCEHVAWRHFRRGPGRTWDDVPWVAFELFLTRDQLEKLSPEYGSQVQLDTEVERADKKDGDNPPEIYKRARVWEIWDKESRKVIFIATGFKDKPIRQEDDPLKLVGFWPIPRPLYSVETSDNLVPVVPYEIYRDQAEELEQVSRRIMAVTKAIKARAAYDARGTELARLSEADDNELVPIDNVTLFANGEKIEDKVLWWPIETLVIVLEKLYEAREQIKQTIYEITGISDILRGQTQASETATAQNIKQQWGSLRIQRKQAEIARYARDLFRLKAEIIATKFQWQTISMMTGLSFPPKAAQQQAQQIAQQAQQTQQPVPPQVKQALSLPSQEDVEQLLRNDAMRGFRVDIESDSTIRADLTRNQQNMNLFLQGTSQFAAAMGPILMAPQFQALAPAVIEVYSAFARNFKLGKQAEDALDGVGDMATNMAQQQPQPDPVEQAKAEAMQRQAKVEEDRLQLDAQEKAARLQLDAKDQQDRIQIEREKMFLDHRVKLAGVAATTQVQREKTAASTAVAREANATNADVAREKTAASTHVAREKAAMDDRTKRDTAKMSDATTRASLKLKGKDGGEKLANPPQPAEQEPEQGDFDMGAMSVPELEDKMAQAFQMLAQAIQQQTQVLAAPRQLVRDAQGRPVASQIASQ